jgi:hypothetical protein
MSKKQHEVYKNGNEPILFRNKHIVLPMLMRLSALINEYIKNVKDVRLPSEAHSSLTLH